MKQLVIFSAILVSLFTSCTPQPATTNGPTFDEVVTFY